MLPTIPSFQIQPSDIPQLFVQWSKGLLKRRGANRLLGMAEAAVQGETWSSSAEARNALVMVAAHENSPQSRFRALTLLKKMSREMQLPSNSAVNAVLRCYSNGKCSIGETSSALTTIEDAMRETGVRPTPRFVLQIVDTRNI